MANFPALKPTGRTFTQGIYPHTRHGVYSGREVRVRHSNTSVGNRLRLAFGMVSTAEMLSVRDHYAGQLGGVLAFEIPDDLLAGVNTPADFTPAGHRWLYVGSPLVTDVPLDQSTPTLRHMLEVELQSLPAEGTIAPGGRLRVAISWAPGYAPRRLALGVTISWAPGGASALVPGLAETATASWAGGFAPRPVPLNVSATWAPGGVGAPGFALTAAASFAGGAGSDGGASPPPAAESTFIRPVWAFDALFLWDGEDW
jgi:hypothetical protein